MKARRSAELLLAVRKGEVAKVETLLQQRACVNTCSGNKVSPLMLVASKGQVDACACLLAYKAPVDARDERHQRTALMYACVSSTNNVADVLQALLDGGATIDLQDAAGRSGLMLAAEAGNGAAALFLLDNGAEVSMIAHNGKLCHESMGFTENVARRFLINVTGKPTNAVDTYMHMRRVQDEKEEQDLLRELEQLEDNNDWGGSTFPSETLDAEMMDACGLPPATQIDTTATREEDNYGEEEEEEEVDEDYWYRVDTLPGGTFLSKVAPLRPRDLAKPPPDPKIRKMLIAQSEKLRGITRQNAGAGDTALTIAARKGHADVCDLLIHFGADATIPDGNGDTALIVAARCGHVKAVQTLLTMHPCRQAHAAALQAAEQAGSEATMHMLRGYDVGCSNARITRQAFST